MSSLDTIVACATPWGRGAVSLVRLSGAGCVELAQALCPGGPPWRARRSSVRTVRDGHGAPIDDALCVWMRAPRSFTGEHVVELGVHGNPVVVEAVIDRCVALGARPARPGEFTRRAVIHGRMDLLQAEALASLVSAGSPEGVALARHGMRGQLSDEMSEMRESLLDAASEMELRLDHPGEDLGELGDAALALRLSAAAGRARALSGQWRAGRVRLEGARIALLGPVNAGKSSLFNVLLGSRRALVSATPGTTRDVVEGRRIVDGLEICLLDTAGQRLEPGALEREGQMLAEDLTADADLRLWVVPVHEAPSPASIALLERPGPWLRVGTHGDLLEGCAPMAQVDCVVSGRTGAGVDALWTELRRRVAGVDPAGSRAVLTSQRQHALLVDIADRLDEARAALLGFAGVAVAAEELTVGLARLAELTGEDAREAVLDRLFARFCIGK